MHGSADTGQPAAFSLDFMPPLCKTSFTDCLLPILTLVTCLHLGRPSTCLQSCYTMARMAQIRHMTPEAQMYGLLV